MFDPNKVAWTEEELEMAENADKIYEVVGTAMEDGLQLTDLAVIPAAIHPTLKLYAWLAVGSKAEMGRKLLALGTMLERDNEFF